MILLSLDAEQAEIISAIADCAEAMLSARVVRADPDGIVSDSLSLQRMKMQQVRRQLQPRPIPDWSKLSEEERKNVTECARILAGSADGPSHSTALDIILGIALRRRVTSEVFAPLFNDELA
jgi:hypothetical protein